MFKQHIAVDFGFGQQAGLDSLPSGEPIGEVLAIGLAGRRDRGEQFSGFGRERPIGPARA